MNRLVISDASREDSGQYRCEAINDYSSASAMVEIQVAGKIRICIFCVTEKQISYSQELHKNLYTLINNKTASEITAVKFNIINVRYVWNIWQGI